LRNDDVSNKTKRAIGEALEQLEGQPVLDPALIIAKADNMIRKKMAGCVKAISTN